MSVIQIIAREASELLKKDQFSVLADVRTKEEFDSVGIVDSMSFEGRMILLPWQTFPSMAPNPEFDFILEEELARLFSDNFKENKIIFLCRTGGRSQQAALHAVNLGYKNCYNIISGFEGDLDKEGKRGNINGWKASNLPWRKK
jgi:rhodanese-related sulfurtransferase